MAEVEGLLGRPTSGELADRLGVSVDRVCKWRQRGLSERQADEVASALDFHPAIVWPTWAEA